MPGSRRKVNLVLPIYTAVKTLFLKIRSRILAICVSRKYNMFDIPAVQRERYELGFHRLIILIKDYKADHAHFILISDLLGLLIFI